MTFPDYIVLGCYFVLLVVIGVYCMRRIKHQEDYFMGGRGFGKLLQTFAAFGAGTGSNDPIQTARNSYTGGVSGMWSVMYWLFVTPFYWITGVWYRRMRHMTLGDWYVERYESKPLGAAYSIFGVTFFMIYGSMFFTAIAKTAAPMITGGDGVPIETIGPFELNQVLIPVIGVIVVLYGIAGGLTAAYFTDLIQGICIIGLSIMLIPIGLNALTENEELNPAGDKSGFEIMHDQLPEGHFDLLSSAGEFSLYYLIAIVFANLLGIVVQPHFIATGGGSAKNENSARIGLVTGNFLKRFCTIGWLLTALIAATLYADVPELIQDPDKTWGYATMELLGPGLRGLMLACLLAALMSSVDAQMVVGSALIVRNLYAPYIKPQASEQHYLWVGRITGALIVTGSIIFSLSINDMLGQLKLNFWFPLVFAAPFWLGMYWRRANTKAAWITVVYCLFFFFLIPYFGPTLFTSWRTNTELTQITPIVETTTMVTASKSELRKQFIIAHDKWAAESESLSGDALASHQSLEPERVSQTEIRVPQDGQMINIIAGETKLPVTKRSGGTALFWDKVEPVKEGIEPVLTGTDESADKVVRTLAYPEGTELQGMGNLKLNLLMFKPLGVELQNKPSSTLSALELVPKIVMPFVLMIVLSFVLPFRNSKEALDRYYAKMKTSVDSDPEKDKLKLKAVYEDPSLVERENLFPNTQLEIQKPTFVDIAGFVVSVVICFIIIAFVFWLAGIGG